VLTEWWDPRPPLSRAQRARAQVRRAFELSPHRPVVERDADPLPADVERRFLRSQLAGPGVDYLKDRGIPADVAERAGVRYMPSFLGRPAVTFPIKDRAGRLIAVCGRYIDGGEDLKTKSRGPKSHGVFAIKRTYPDDPLIIVEGPMCALTLASIGYGSVALVGLTWPDWLPALCRGQRVWIATDADPSGDGAAADLAAALRAQLVDPMRLRPVVGKDWNDQLVELGPDALEDTLFALDLTSRLEAVQ
jgi:DNA primase